MRGKFFALLAGALSLGAMQVASAADMPAKAPVFKPALAVATSWTGLYVNGGVGSGIWTADTTTQSAATGACVLCTTQTQGGKGWVGVVGIGYDYQFLPSFLAGVFGDYNFGNLKGTVQDQFPFFAGDTKEKSAWSVGARLGWLVTPSSMVYVNGGYTAASFTGANMVTTFASAPTTFTTADTTFRGWFIGGGTETTVPILGAGWFWRNEYRYASYRNQTLTDSSGGVAMDSINFKPTVHTITSQIVYKLNTGGPVFNAPAPVAPVNWTGLYVNGGVGYGAWAADTTTQLPSGFPGAGTCILCTNEVQGGKGWLGVVGIGYDHLLTPKILVGLLANYDLSSLKGTLQDQLPFFAGDIKQTSAWSIGGRAGWLVTPQVLTYANAGFTSARFSGTNMVFTVTPFSGTASGNTTPAFTTNGWFLGGGMEVAVGSGWFWRNEYRYARYKNQTLADTGPVIAADINFKPAVQTITTQAVYKLNWMQ
ncbi:MAG TPA: outer membrane beta-barrel protein [Pseudolabrys sp.]|nr:outer membrane beta-barrel protein [Pseudolabrys sp.]